jgi:hypothetical protein
MTWKLNIVGFLQGMLLASVSLINAQDSPPRTPASIWDLHVDITIDKKVYLRSEPFRYRVVLRNSGKSAVYVAKSFSQAGGGIAGFYVDVKQLTGKRSMCTVMAMHAFVPHDARTPEQILREDYLLLSAGELIGFEWEYDCVKKYSGTYQITATYAAQDLNINKVRLLADKADAIVVGRFQSKPLTFRVSDRQ